MSNVTHGFVEASKAFQDLTKAMNESMSALNQWYLAYKKASDLGGVLLARHRRRRHK